MNHYRKTRISKIFTYLLRHGAKTKNIPIDEEGFITLENVFAYVHSQVKPGEVKLIDLDFVKDIVATDSKGRLHFDEENMRLRANQGHSIKIDSLELRTIKVTDTGYDLVVHGTYKKNKSKIIDGGGLMKMSRNHVHMTNVTVDESNNSLGYKLMRDDADLYVVVNLRAAITDGIPFYESTNNVVLTDHDIPLKYLTFLDKAHSKIPCLGVIVYGYDKKKNLYLSMVRSHHGNWSYPKGKKHKKEKSIESALRELREETGIREKDITFIQHDLLIELSDRGKPATAYYVARYNKLVVPTDPLKFVDPDELTMSQWIPLKQILSWEDTEDFGKLRPRRQELCKLIQFA